MPQSFMGKLQALSFTFVTDFIISYFNLDIIKKMVLIYIFYFYVRHTERLKKSKCEHFVFKKICGLDTSYVILGEWFL